MQSEGRAQAREGVRLARDALEGRDQERPKRESTRAELSADRHRHSEGLTEVTSHCSFPWDSMWVLPKRQKNPLSLAQQIL